MARRKKPEAEARASMKSLGIYKPEFEMVIKIYGQLREQYDVLTKRFLESDFDFEEETTTGTKKAPIVTTLESLRKDILTYAAQLGLTPSGLKKINDSSMKPEKRSVLGDALLALSRPAEAPPPAKKPPRSKAAARSG